MVKKKKKKKLKFNKAGLKKAVLDIFYANPKKTFNYKQLSSELYIRDMPTKKLIHVVLEELRDNENLEEIGRGKYKLRSKGGYVTGTVELTQQGFGFVISDEIDQDVFVSAANLKRAMHGDKVKVYLYARRKKHNPEGEVVEILERAKTTFVGTVEVSKFHAFLVPSGKSPFDLFIPKEKLNGAKDGQKAIAKIIEWPERSKNPYAEIIEVLGNVGENDTEMHAILLNSTCRLNFLNRWSTRPTRFRWKFRKRNMPTGAISGKSPPLPLTRLMPRTSTMPFPFINSTMVSGKLVSTLPM